MLWHPGGKGVLRHEHNTGTVGATSPGTSVTTGGAANTKGTPAELIASTSFDAYWITIIAHGYATGTTACEGAMDLLIGASTEAILIPDLLFGHCGFYGAGSGKGPKRWDFPLYIPAGSRLAVQAAGARTTTAFNVIVHLYGGNAIAPTRVGSSVTTYGMGTVPNGTTVTPGASGAEGTWTQITASTTASHFAVVPSYQVSADASTNNRTIAVDIGVGAATEEEIVQGYWYATSSNEEMEGPFNTFPGFIDIPSGSRLVMRASNSGTNDGGYNGVIHAVS